MAPSQVGALGGPSDTDTAAGRPLLSDEAGGRVGGFCGGVAGITAPGEAMSRVQVTLALALSACRPGYRGKLAAEPAAQPSVAAAVMQTPISIHIACAEVWVAAGRQLIAR